MEEIHSDIVHCVQMLYICYIYNAYYVTVILSDMVKTMLVRAFGEEWWKRNFK